jgi:dienelactone hydrolase
MCGAIVILSGERDDWCPAEACQRFAADAVARGRNVSVTVYPGATHAFDSVGGGKSLEFLGHRLTSDATAAKASRERLLAFFDQTLKP